MKKSVGDRIGTGRVAKMNSEVTSGILTVLLLTITMSHVNATEVKTVTVEPGDVGTLKLSLEKEQRFKGSLTIVDGAEIDFWIVAPTAEDYVVELHRINQEAEFEFVTKESGTHLFVFRNLSSAESTTIELYYDIYSQTKITFDFFTLVLISVGLLAIIIIVVWWKS